jgi:hypothetical protein
MRVTRTSRPAGRRSAASLAGPINTEPSMMPTPPTETPGPRRPDVRRPAGVSRFGVLAGFVATAGTLAVAFLGLGGPPAPAAPLALADATATEPAVQQVVVKTVYVQLPSPSAAPVATPVAVPVASAPQPAARVVTRQSGAGGGEGGEGGEQEGND